MTTDNVTSMPSRRDRLAVEINMWVTKKATHAKDGIEIDTGLCLALAAARKEFSANIEFGQWCEANGFGKKIISHQDRAAAIKMGNEPELLRAVLKTTRYKTFENIYRFDWAEAKGRFTLQRKTTQSAPVVAPAPTPQPTPAVQPAPAEPAPTPQPTPPQPAPVPPAQPTPVTTLSPSAKERFDAALRAATKKIREELRIELYDEIKAKVSAEFDIRIKYFNDKIARADRILTSHKGVMSRADYRKILACLHPDHNKFAPAAEALQLFSSLEKVLVKQDEPVITMPGPPMPKNAEEMMQWRKGRGK